MFKEEKMRKIWEIKRFSPLLRFEKSIHKIDGRHYWEMGKAEHPISEIVDDVQTAGFEMIRCLQKMAI